MSEDQIQEIISAVLSAIRTNSLTISQLTLVESLPDNCFFEISGGRKISSSFIKELVADYVQKETDSIRVSIADLYKKVGDYNVSTLFPTKGINGSDKYTLELSIAVLNSNLLDSYKRAWTRIFYKTENNKTVGYIYQGDGFEDISNWKPIIVQEYGSSLISAISQKLFTNEVQGRTLGIIDIKEIDSLSHVSTSLGHYHVFDNLAPIGEMIVTSDNMRHTVIQFMFSNYSVEGTGGLGGCRDDAASIVYRIYNFNSPNLSDIPKGTWGKWTQYGQNYQVLTETEYDALANKNPDVFYYTYDEEEEGA